MSIINLCSIDNIARAESLSWHIVFLKNVFILFRVEKHLSASAVVIGIVTNMFNNFAHSLNVDSRLFSRIKSYRLTIPDAEENTSVL